MSREGQIAALAYSAAEAWPEYREGLAVLLGLVMGDPDPDGTPSGILRRRPTKATDG